MAEMFCLQAAALKNYEVDSPSALHRLYFIEFNRNGSRHFIGMKYIVIVMEIIIERYNHSHMKDGIYPLRFDFNDKQTV